MRAKANINSIIKPQKPQHSKISKLMRKTSTILTLVFASILFVSCIALPEPKGKSISASLLAPKDIDANIDYTQPYEIMRDTMFRNGLDLSGFSSSDLSKVVIGSINYNDTVSGYRYWRLDQWGCKYNLGSSQGKLIDGFWVQKDESKQIDINTSTGEVSMRLDTSKEYVTDTGAHKPREYFENWPSLLLTQFTHLAPLGSMQHLYMSVEFTITKVVNAMTDGTMDESLHSAQFQWYITPQMWDKDKKQLSDMFWFGLPFYDYRYSDLPEFSGHDGGKEDASHKYIYMMPGKSVFKSGSATIGNREVISVDVLPYIQSAIDKGKAAGYLKNATMDEMVISTTNIGWEVPGTFDIGVDIHSMSMIADWKKINIL